MHWASRSVVEGSPTISSPEDSDACSARLLNHTCRTRGKKWVARLNTRTKGLIVRRFHIVCRSKPSARYPGGRGGL